MENISAKSTRIPSEYKTLVEQGIILMITFILFKIINYNIYIYNRNYSKNIIYINNKLAKTFREEGEYDQAIDILASIVEKAETNFGGKRY